jgi:hypothetical protein
MKNRVTIWIVVALTGIGVVLALQHLQRTDDEQRGRVTFRKKSGDLMQFLTRELRQYGGSPTNTGSAPAMLAEWRYSEDPKGFQILISQTYKDELIRSLIESLGEPTRRDLYPHLVYKEDRFGVGIVADLQSDPIHIICLRRGSL